LHPISALLLRAGHAYSATFSGWHGGCTRMHAVVAESEYGSA